MKIRCTWITGFGSRRYIYSLSKTATANVPVAAMILLLFCYLFWGDSKMTKHQYYVTLPSQHNK